MTDLIAPDRIAIICSQTLISLYTSDTGDKAIQQKARKVSFVQQFLHDWCVFTMWAAMLAWNCNRSHKAFSEMAGYLFSTSIQNASKFNSVCFSFSILSLAMLTSSSSLACAHTWLLQFGPVLPSYVRFVASATLCHVQPCWPCFGRSSSTNWTLAAQWWLVHMMFCCTDSSQS